MHPWAAGMQINGLRSRRSFSSPLSNGLADGCGYCKRCYKSSLMLSIVYTYTYKYIYIVFVCFCFFRLGILWNSANRFYLSACTSKSSNEGVFVERLIIVWIYTILYYV